VRALAVADDPDEHKIFVSVSITASSRFTTGPASPP